MTREQFPPPASRVHPLADSLPLPADRGPRTADRTGAQVMCEALIRENVEVMFGIPGGAIMPFYHAMWEYRDRIRHVLCRHEQGAGHAAEGYARSTGKTGVCVATSGPGATNLVTPIANAWLDSTPLVAITGQVSSAVLGKDAFQETDITGITLPITKHNYRVSRAEDLPSIFHEAFHIARSGRPGPVLIDVTKDAQQARVVPDWNVSLNVPGMGREAGGGRRYSKPRDSWPMRASRSYSLGKASSSLEPQRSCAPSPSAQGYRSSRLCRESAHFLRIIRSASGCRECTGGCTSIAPFRSAMSCSASARVSTIA